MSYVHISHTETLPSARERIAALRKESEQITTRAAENLMAARRTGDPAIIQLAVLNASGLGERMILLDIADILLDAMKHGPDNPIVRDIPGRSQMQEQGPAEGVPHTGLPPERTRSVKQVPDTRQGPPDLPVDRTLRFTIGQAVCITAVPPSHRHPHSQDMHSLIGRGATIMEVEAWQDWMTEPWYRLRCPHGADIGPGHSEGSLPQHCLNRIAEGVVPEDVRMLCDNCNGRGCDHCGQRGHFGYVTH